MGFGQESEPRPVASFSLTHVQYNPHDPLSLVSACLALAPQALIVCYVTLIYATREIEILLLFGGQLSSEAVNYVLKHIFKQERPEGSYGHGYGMPSSHSQFMAFFSVSMALFLGLRYTEQKLHPQKPRPDSKQELSSVPGSISLSIRVLTGSAIALSAIFVAISRIYLSYHTPEQVVVGVSVGAIFAVVWFVFIEVLRRVGMIDFILDLPIVQWGRWRDLVITEDLSQAGWEKWQRQRAERRRTAAKEE